MVAWCQYASVVFSVTYGIMMQYGVMVLYGILVSYGITMQHGVVVLYGNQGNVTLYGKTHLVGT